MSIGAMVSSLIDKGGRRSGIDQRHFVYTDHVPSRRSDQDRRSGLDRRNGLDRRSGLDRRLESKVIGIENRKNGGRRGGMERRISFALAMASG